MAARTHGMSKTRFYGIWNDMMMRCYNPNKERYPRYGGRGIGVDKRWHTFSNFKEDMLATYQKGLSLERKRVNEYYSKENCLWIVKSKQAENKENTVYLEVNGVSKRIPEWAAETGEKIGTIYQRIYLGWSAADCIYGRGKKVAFTTEVIESVKIMHKEGLSLREIARRIGSSHSSVSRFV